MHARHFRYDKAGAGCGPPLGTATTAGAVHTRTFAHCAVKLDCTNPTNCVGSIDFQ